MAKRIGVISDTHGLLRDEAASRLRGCGMILHAGDVGGPSILEELRRIAPLVAVRGNVDTGAWAGELPQMEHVQIEGTAICIIHNLAELDLDAAAAGVNVVIYGHSHKPAADWKDGVLYLNPGSAGPRRFRLPVSMAFLHIGPEGAAAEMVALEDDR
jgi:hypothetical protein